MASLLALVGLAGCATYQRMPLGDGADNDALARTTTMHFAPDRLAGFPVKPHRFDPGDGLDVTEVAMLAVAASPDLRVQRDKLGVARAQAFAAGLLPDPQLSYEHDSPTSNQPDLTSAFNLGLSFDLGNLLTRSARVASARAGVREVRLQVLWSEWQAIARARELFNAIYWQRRWLRRLDREHAALAPLLPAIEKALDNGDLTYDAASSGLDAGIHVSNQRADAERKLHQDEHDLRALLGLAPDAPLRLVGPPYTVQTSAERVRAALRQMTQRRPDLLALKAGYTSQEQKVRAAILGQFPAPSVGLVRARDTSNVYTLGFTVGLSLPLFDRNRGNIAEARANRQQLRDEYHQRVLSARLDIAQMSADLASYHRQRPKVLEHDRQLQAARRAARRAYDAGLLDWPTYLAIRASALSAASDRTTLATEAGKQAIALSALAGAWPAAATSAGSKP